MLAKIDQDRLEQYSRKENIKIIGLKEDDQEDENSLITGVTALGVAIGVEIKEADVSVIHRLGKAGGGKNRTVLARFSSRRKANALLKNKKKLKDCEAIRTNALFEDKVIINEDLTAPRRKLLAEVKKNKKS